MSLTVSGSQPVSLVPSIPNVKPSVLIVGGGPAGLMRAILALKNGNPTRIIEKRSQWQAGRDNSVALKQDAIDVLKEHGIYDYLITEKLVHPPTLQWGLTVRLGDLEKAMKSVISSLTKDPVFSYSTEVGEIHSRKDKQAEVVIHSKNGVVERLYPDVLVIADGSHSSTEKLLGISRAEVLPPVPVVAAIFKDNRPKIVSVSTFFKYIGLTLLNTLTKVYYCSFAIFKMIFQGERVSNPHRKIIGGVILSSPGQTYMGYCLNEKESQKIVEHDRLVQDCKAKLAEVEKRGDLVKIAAAKKDLEVAVKRRDKNLEHWAQLSFFFTNILFFAQYVFQLICCRKNREWLVAKWLPFDKEGTKMITIGADKANKSCGLLNKTCYLISGDALATVDPVTARGCRTAIVSSSLFTKVIKGLEKREAPLDILCDYRIQSDEIVNEIHKESIAVRKLYRPQTAIV